MAGLTSGKTNVWAVKWFEVIVALAIANFGICAFLTLAYSAGASSTMSPSDRPSRARWRPTSGATMSRR